ncbi:MAG: hypothetical protein ACE366_11975 [Bradymonadia bacterium]
MTTDLLHNVAEHLQYLGYTIEDHTPGEGLRVTHKQRYGTTFKVFQNGLLLRTYFDTRAEPHQLLYFANSLNQEAVVARFLLGKDGLFVMEAWMAAPYDRGRFAAFMDAWHQDATTLTRSPMAGEVLE